MSKDLFEDIFWDVDQDGDTDIVDAIIIDDLYQDDTEKRRDEFDDFYNDDGLDDF